MATSVRTAALAAAVAVTLVTAIAGCSSDSDSAADTDSPSASRSGSPNGSPGGSAPAPGPGSSSGAPGTSPGASSPGNAPGGSPGDGTIAAGPGPQSPYTVQKQPAAGSCRYRDSTDKQPLPDPTCTPGSTNPKVTRQTVRETICKAGYAQSIRPPADILAREKSANAASYAFKGELDAAGYDHLIGLELGGDPNDARNLWVQPPAAQGPRDPKGAVEARLNSAVCKGQTTLADAQWAIAHDWTTALTVLGLRADPDSDGSGAKPPKGGKGKKPPRGSVKGK